MTRQEIDAELTAEHDAILADAGLRTRAEAAIPILRQHKEAARREAAEKNDDLRGPGSHAWKERGWTASGGADAYAREIGLSEHLLCLTRLVEGAKPDGWHGWLRREDVERALRAADALP